MGEPASGSSDIPVMQARATAAPRRPLAVYCLSHCTRARTRSPGLALGRRGFMKTARWLLWPLAMALTLVGCSSSMTTDAETESSLQGYHSLYIEDRKSTRLNSSHVAISYA